MRKIVLKPGELLGVAQLVREQYGRVSFRLLASELKLRPETVREIILREPDGEEVRTMMRQVSSHGSWHEKTWEAALAVYRDTGRLLLTDLADRLNIALNTAHYRVGRHPRAQDLARMRKGRPPLGPDGQVDIEAMAGDDVLDLEEEEDPKWIEGIERRKALARIRKHEQVCRGRAAGTARVGPARIVSIYLPSDWKLE